MSSQWTVELSVGVPELDRQHEELYGAAATLHDSMRSGNREALPAILARLRRFADTHFATEEQLMAKLGYPQLAGHRERHAAFLARLGTFEAGLAGGRRASPSLIVEVSIFLATWMRDHIRGDDGAFGRWVAARDGVRAA